MENKSALVLVLVMGLATTGVLAFLFQMLKPAGVRESEQTGAPSESFPGPIGASATRRPAPPPQDPQPAPDGGMPAAPRRLSPPPASSSLGFIRTEGGIEGNSSPDAAEAAAAGDAKALVSELKRKEAPPKQAEDEQEPTLTEAAIRKVMQKVVDTVHQKQPGWYREFLSRKDLKAIADRYDGSNDFRAFLRDLADSENFNRMMEARRGTLPMKRVISTLMGDGPLAKNLRRMMSEYSGESSTQFFVARYGDDFGVPKSMVLAAQQAQGMSPAGGSARRQPQKKLQLKGGFGSNSLGNNQGGTPRLPPGVSQEQFQKFLQQNSQ